MLRESVEPDIQRAAHLQNLHFKEIDLGFEPVQFGNMRSATSARTTARGQVEGMHIDLELVYYPPTLLTKIPILEKRNGPHM